MITWALSHQKLSENVLIISVFLADPMSFTAYIFYPSIGKQPEMDLELLKSGAFICDMGVESI